MDSKHSWLDIVDGIAATVTGLGLLTFVLFPFAVPMLALTIGAMVLLTLPLVAFAAVVAILTGTWLGIRAAGRSLRRLRRPRGGAAGSPTALPKRRPGGSARSVSGDAAASGLVP